MSAASDLLNGYTREELVEAFELVQPTSHWKDAIDATIVVPTGKSLEITYAIREAVSFFTATPAKVVDVSRRFGETVLHVTAAGYHAGPAGDH